MLLLTLLLFYPAETGGKAPEHTQGCSQGLPVLPQAVLWDPSAGGAWSRHRASPLPPGMLLMLPGPAPTSAEPSPKLPSAGSQGEERQTQPGQRKQLPRGAGKGASSSAPLTGVFPPARTQAGVLVLGSAAAAQGGHPGGKQKGLKWRLPFLSPKRERGKPLKFPCLILPVKRICRLCV